MSLIIKHKYYLLLPLVAFLIYSFLWSNIPMMAPDTKDYIAMAQDIQDGSIDHLHIRTPGYPLLLLLTDSLETATNLLYIQLLLYIASVMALAYVLYTMTVSKPIILLFTIFAFLPHNVSVAVSATTEVLTIFTLTFGFLFLFLWLTKEKVIYLSFSAILFAYAALTRPTYQLILILFIFVFVISLPYIKQYKNKFLHSIFAIFISSIIFIGGVLYINYSKFNFLGLTPLLGFNLSTKTVTVLERLPDKYSEVRKILIEHRNADLIKEGSSHTALMYVWGTSPELQKATGLDEIELSKFMKEINLLLIKKAPIHYLKEVGYSTVSYWFPNISGASHFGSRILQLIYTLIHFLVIVSFFLSLISLFSFKLISMLFKDKTNIFNADDELFFILLSLVLTIIFYTMFISTAVEMGNPRYRAPTDLFILFSIAYIFNFIKEKTKLNNLNLSQQQ